MLNRKISQDLNQNVSLPVIMMCLQGPLVLHVCYALVTRMLFTHLFFGLCRFFLCANVLNLEYVICSLLVGIAGGIMKQFNDQLPVASSIGKSAAPVSQKSGFESHWAGSGWHAGVLLVHVCGELSR